MWKNININSNLIEVTTAKSALIRCPNKSQFKNYKFWHPLKCVHRGKHSAAVSIGYTDDFTFKLVKYGANRNILDEVILSVDDFEKLFETVDSNITAKIMKVRQ